MIQTLLKILLGILVFDCCIVAMLCIRGYGYELFNKHTLKHEKG